MISILFFFQQELKLTYYNLMVRYWSNQDDYLEIAKCYQAMYDTPKVKANPDQWKKVRVWRRNNT